jgi:hypothetical protein
MQGGLLGRRGHRNRLIDSFLPWQDLIVVNYIWRKLALVQKIASANECNQASRDQRS